MQRLVISVEDNIANYWRETPREKQEEAVRLFSLIVKKIGSEPMTHERFFQLLDKLSEQAIANGLTEEILEEILHEN